MISYKPLEPTVVDSKKLEYGPGAGRGAEASQ